MTLELVSKGPELFRIHYTYWLKEDIGGVPGILERSFPEGDWVLVLTLGCPYGELIPQVEHEFSKDKKDQDFNYLTLWNEIPIFETYPYPRETTPPKAYGNIEKSSQSTTNRSSRSTYHQSG